MFIYLFFFLFFYLFIFILFIFFFKLGLLLIKLVTSSFGMRTGHGSLSLRSTSVPRSTSIESFNGIPMEMWHPVNYLAPFQ